MGVIDRDILSHLYLEEGKSMQEIADNLHCSLNTIYYWIKKYCITTRSHSEATYLKRNPNGDPFSFKEPETALEIKLLGIGIGLYWGEGNKANKNSIRLGNVDPALIRCFIDFLIVMFGIAKEDLRFGLQIFSDIEIGQALDFWIKELNIQRSQINKPIITKSGSIGTYRKKSRYGVLTVMYHNKKLRDLLISLLPM